MTRPPPGDPYPGRSRFAESFSMPIPTAPVRWAVFVLALLVPSGCAPEPEVRGYDVPKAVAPDAPPEQPAKVRMLAAVIPTPADPTYSWFVKLTGPIEAVTKAEADFNAFVSSLAPTGDEKAPLKWTVPAGWTADMSNPNRLVTLTGGPADAPLQVSVSGPFGGSLASNVNRWRGLDAGLPKVSDAEALKAAKEGTVGTLKVFRVDLRGPGSAKKGMMGG